MLSRLILLCASLFIDISASTFILPFLPDRLAEEGYSNFSVGLLVSSFFLSSLVGYYLTLKNQILRPHITSATRWKYLTVSSVMVMVACLMATAAPNYYMIILARAIQGICSAVFWTYAMSLAAEMDPVWGISAIAVTMAGCNIGELSGPWLGTVAYEISGHSVRLSFLVLGALALVISLCSIKVTMSVVHEERLTRLAPLSSVATPSDSIAGGADAAPKEVEMVNKRQHKSPLLDTSHVDSEALTPQLSSSSSGPRMRRDSLSTVTVVASPESTTETENPFEATTPDSTSAAPSSESDLSSSESDLPSSQTAPVTPSWTPVLRTLRLPLFQLLCALLFLFSMPRSCLDVIIPLFFSRELDASTTTVGAVFGIASAFYLVGTLCGPRLRNLNLCARMSSALPISGGEGAAANQATAPDFHGDAAAASPSSTGPAAITDEPAHPVSAPISGLLGVIIIIGAIIMSLILFMPGVVFITLAMCAFAFVSTLLSVLACEELEELARVLRSHDNVAADRLMALACLIWTSGFALGNLLGGASESASGQRLTMIGCALLNIVYLPFFVRGLRKHSLTDKAVRHVDF